MPLTSFWCHYCQFHTYFTSCPGGFSVSIVNLEQVKSRLGSKSYRSKSHYVTHLLFVRNVLFIIVRGELRTCGTSKLGLFAKLVYSLKSSLTILIRSSISRSITGCWICLGYFFRFTIYLQLSYWFILLTLRLTFDYSINLFSTIYSMHTCIHVFTSPFIILSFNDGIKLKFVALITRNDV